MSGRLFVAALLAASAWGQSVELLWPNGAPGAIGQEDRDKPAITIHLPDPAKAVGTGVVVFPGGGYGALAMDHEGKQIAQWLNERGVAAFVTRYRLGPRYKHPIMITDAQRAIEVVRSRAKEFGVGPDRIGVWGFSAGGHLASSTATLFGRPEHRPDFAILCYPVISMDTSPMTHKGSRRNLIGEDADAALSDKMTTYKQVTPQTPPVFLFHTNADTGVVPENSVEFYLALRRAGVPAEMHIFENGRHGVGLAQKDPALSHWPVLLENWMRGRGLLTPRK